MRNRHITRFGSLLAPSGGLYFITDQHGLIQMDVDMQLEQLRAKGVFITPDIKSRIKDDVQQRRAEYNASVSRLGIPENLNSLFQTTSKAEAEQCARKITVTEYDLFLLIHNCNQIHFTHRAKFKP